MVGKCFFKVLVGYTTSCCVLSNHACNVYIFSLCNSGICALILFLFICLFLASTPPPTSPASDNAVGKLLIVNYCLIIIIISYFSHWYCSWTGCGNLVDYCNCCCHHWHCTVS